MNSKLWFSEFTTALLRAGLPVAYIERSVVELKDHFSQYESETGELPGDSVVPKPREMSTQFIVTYRASRWYRKIPSLIWLFVPLPLSVLVCLVFYGSGIICLDLIFEISSVDSDVALAGPLLFGLFCFGKVFTPAAASSLLMVMLHRSCRPAWVLVGSVVLLGAAFSLTMTEMQLPVRGGDGEFTLTMGTDTFEQLGLVGWHVIQAAIVFVVAMCWQLRRRAKHVGLLVE